MQGSVPNLQRRADIAVPRIHRAVRLRDRRYRWIIPNSSRPQHPVLLIIKQQDPESRCEDRVVAHVTTFDRSGSSKKVVNGWWQTCNNGQTLRRMLSCSSRIDKPDNQLDRRLRFHPGFEWTRNDSHDRIMVYVTVRDRFPSVKITGPTLVSLGVHGVSLYSLLSSHAEPIVGYMRSIGASLKKGEPYARRGFHDSSSTTHGL